MYHKEKPLVIETIDFTTESLAFQNRYIFILGSIDEVCMQVGSTYAGRRMRGEVWPKAHIYCFSDAIFFLKCIQGRLGIKKIGLLQRTHFMGGTLAKSCATKVSAIS